MNYAERLRHPLWQYIAGTVTMLCVSGIILYEVITHLPYPLGSIIGAFLFFWLFWLSYSFFIEPLYTLGFIAPFSFFYIRTLVSPFNKLVSNKENQKKDCQHPIKNAEPRAPCTLKMKASIDCIENKQHKYNCEKPIGNKVNILLIFVQRLTSLLQLDHRKRRISGRKSDVNSNSTETMLFEASLIYGENLHFKVQVLA
jgi:hypothetical protein